MSSNRLPNFIVIGAQKSASTFIHRALERHPDVYMPRDEIRFFEDPEYTASKIKDLEDLFVGHETRLLRGIKRPDYLSRPEVPKRIHQHLPNVRMVAILRNPVRRAISAYFYYIKLGLLPAIPIDEGIPLIQSGDWDKRYPRGREIIEYGFYSKHLQNYYEYFAREQLLVLLQDDVHRDPLGCIEQTCEFLGVPMSKNMVHKNVRENKGVYSIERLKFLTRRNRFLYEYDAASKLRVKKLDLISWTAVATISAIDRYILSWSCAEGTISADSGAARNLASFYRADVAQLSRILGRELPDWREFSNSTSD